MRRTAIWRSLFFCLLCTPLAAAQAKREGAIAGRVLGEGGRPLAGVEVSINRIGVKRGAEQTGVSDEEGNFQFTNLAPGVYAVDAGMPGFVVEGASRGSNVYRIGEQATIRLTKGGVITGRVTDETGEPLIGVYVSPHRVRGVEVESSDSKSPDRELRNYGRQGGLTDDRGIYRIYGLPPGVYVVGICGELGGGGGDSSHVGRDAPTYYPSVPRDAAGEVTLRGSEEISGIDIRHRGEPGRAISGAITGAVESSRPFQFVSVRLTSMEPGRFETMTGVQNSRGFAIFGVPEGEYELRARRYGDEDEAGASSLPKRISVKGADLTGIELKLIKFGSIAGRVTIEPLAKKCEGPAEARRSFVEEITLRALLDDAKSGAADPDDEWSYARYGSVPKASGEFRLNDLSAGRYFLAAHLPDENWYVLAVHAPAPAAVKRTTAAAAMPAAVAQPGIALKSGETLTGVDVKLAEGAAGLRGKLAPAKGAAKLPNRMRIHLIPAEAEAAGDVLRYAETIAERDGAFAFHHLAPGKYLLLARPPAARPLAWDAAARANLRREAEAAKHEIELPPCGRVKEHVFQP